MTAARHKRIFTTKSIRLHLTRKCKQASARYSNSDSSNINNKKQLIVQNRNQRRWEESVWQIEINC